MSDIESMPRPRKSSKKKKAPKRSNRLSRKAILLGLAAALIVLSVTSFLYVDRRIKRILSNPHAESPPAVYAEPYFLANGTAIAEQALRSELQNRRYRETTNTPSNPGEYKFSNDSVEIINRDFVHPDGQTRQTAHVIYSLSDQSVKAADGSPMQGFWLEPEVVSYLGVGEFRASKDKSFDEIPKHIKQAFLAIEDERFYSHHGLDFFGIARAIVKNIMALHIVEGGSTITQQLAKNILFTSQRSITRKFLEIPAAISLESRLTKDEIFERYLNEIYMGQEGSVAIHGIAEGAATFFGKKLEELTLAESALLAGLVKAPIGYSPRRHPERAQKRRNLVLDKMAQLELITAEQAKRAKQEKLTIIQEVLHERNAPHYVAALTQTLAQDLGLDQAGLTGISIYTGIRSNYQHCAEEAVSWGLKRLEAAHAKLKSKPASLEASLLAIEPFSGKVRAWVGGRDYSHNQFDHVVQAKRQIGSTMKPFVYLTALDERLNDYKVATPLTILPDEPMKISLVTRNSWVPENYDHKYDGDMTLRFALENSRNLPTVYLAQRVGIDAVWRTAMRFKIAPTLPQVPALALGAADTNLISLVAAYGALANGGIYVAPRIYLSAVSEAGEVVSTSPVEETRIVDEAPVYVLTNILQGVIERGTAKSIREMGYTGQAAGKTGTSNDTRDAWFIGFTPNLTVGVWLGFDDNSKTGLSGGQGAAPIWAKFMQCVDPYLAPSDFVPPQGVTFTDVDIQTGERATEACPQSSVTKEVFVRGTEPRSFCHTHTGGYDDTSEPDEGYKEPDLASPRRRSSFWDSLFGN